MTRDVRPANCFSLTHPLSDFRFTDASSNFGNMSQIMSFISQHSADYNVSVRYATLSDYFARLHSSNFTFPVQRGLDFEFGWPHVWGIKATGNKTTQYQTGAAVSRAGHKANIRATSRLHRAAESAQAVAVAAGKMEGGGLDEVLMVAWDALGVAQHHDSMPGTMSARGSFVHWHTDTPGPACADSSCMVLEDYTQQLADAQAASQQVLQLSLAAISGASSPVHLQQGGSASTVIVYNPLAYARDEIVAVQLPPPPPPASQTTTTSSSSSSAAAPPPCGLQSWIGRVSQWLRRHLHLPAVAPCIFARKFQL